MIIIDINPVAFHIGNSAVSWYLVAVVACVIILFIVSVAEAKRTHFPVRDIITTTLWIIAGALLFAKLFYIILNVQHFISHPEQILGAFTWNVYTIIAGAILTGLVYFRIKKIPFWQAADIIAVGATAMLAVQRIGCLINGCCHGKAADLPWSLVYLHPGSDAPLGVAIHPTQIYYMLWNAAAFFVLYKLHPRLQRPGTTFLFFLLLYAAGDFIIRFSRDERAVWLGLQLGQLVSLGLLITAILCLIVKMRQASLNH